MKTLIFTLITLSFAFSHAGRIDNYYREIAKVGRSNPVTNLGSIFQRPFLRNFREKIKMYEIGEYTSHDVAFAIKRGDFEKFKLMWEKKPFDPNGKELQGHYIHYAVRSKDPRFLEFLIEKGADLNVEYAFESPLELAFSKGHLEHAKMLIEAGVNVNKRILIINRFPLYRFISDFVNKKGSSLKKSEEIDFIRLFIKKGVDVNAENGIQGDVALNLAILKERLDIVRVLVHEGKADLNKYASIITAVYGRKDILEFLLDNGADINIRPRLKATALENAAKVGDRDMVDFLLSRGADATLRHRGVTSLFYTLDPVIAKTLISRGASVVSRGPTGETALHHAARSVDGYAMLKVLLDNGAHINSKNNNGYTALHYAAARGHLKNVKLLALKGADVLAENNKGETPLMLALRLENQEVANFLKQREKQARLERRR